MAGKSCQCRPTEFGQRLQSYTTTHPPYPAIADTTTDRQENNTESAGMALPCPDKRDATVRSKIDAEVKQLGRRTRELSEEIGLHEGYVRQQESWNAALLESQDASRRWQAYRSGTTGESTDGRRGAVKGKKGIVEENQQYAATVRKWQRGIEVAETLVRLDSKIKECSAKIDRERDEMERLHQEAALLHDEQKAMAIETGGIACVLPSEKSRDADGALLQLKRERTLRERLPRRAGAWLDCESD